MRRDALQGIALLLGFLVLDSCGKSGTSSLPPADQLGGSPSTVPQVLERGTPPPQWTFFAHPANSTHYALPTGDSAEHMWFETTNQVERINYSGGNLGVRATITSGPLDYLTRGGDGNIWYLFTSNTPNGGIDHVYAVNSSGTIEHAYKLPGIDGGSYDVYHPPIIFRGSGDDMWVGRYSPTLGAGELLLIRNGQTTEYPCSGDVPIYGAVTPSGKIWFAGSNPVGYNLIAMDPKTGNCTDEIYPMFTYAGGMTLGPDNNIWVIDTGSNGSVITRVNTASGARSNFGVGLHYQLNDIKAGPDGNLWLSYQMSNTTGLFKVSTSGTVLGKVVCPTSVCANTPSDAITQITSAPDGNIWFAYSGSGTHAGLGAYLLQSMTITPPSVTFSQIGQTQLLKIAEANYNGTWRVVSSNTSVVEVESRPASNEALLKATGVGKAYVAVYDTKGNYYEVMVTVP